MEAGSLKAFLTSLSGFFNNKSLSDAIIRCKGREIAVHKIVLFAHSEYFAKQLDGPWKESPEAVIDIADFDPDVVEAMIHFMYNFNYKPTENTSDTIFHTTMYQIGDKYDIKALKPYIIAKFRAAVESSWDTDEFLATIKLVYTTTLPDDMGLRDSITEITYKNYEKLNDSAGFCEVLREVGDFGFDLSRFLYGKRGPVIRRHQCPKCYGHADFGDDRCFSYSYCIHCGKMDTETEEHTTVITK